MPVLADVLGSGMNTEDQQQEATQHWRESADERFIRIEQRLTAQGGLIDSIAGKLEENTQATKRIDTNTAALVGMMDGVDKLGNAVNWIARKTRPVLLWIAALGAAVTAWKTGIIGPK